MTRQETAVRHDTSVPLFAQLTRETIDRTTPHEAENMLIHLLAQLAHVRVEGKILSWPEFNENPDMLINTLLAKIMLNKIPKEVLRGKQAEQIAVLSIENSAGYLATALSLELERQDKLPRPPRIIRARKSASNTLVPSPAMGEHTAYATVYPITSEEPRFLVASTSDSTDLHNIRVLFVVDDFRATGNTLRGGIEIALDLLGQAGVPLSETTIIPMSGLGKPEQETDASFAQSDARILGVVTGIDVRFWADEQRGIALIQANGHPPYRMHKATSMDFL